MAEGNCPHPIEAKTASHDLWFPKKNVACVIYRGGHKFSCRFSCFLVFYPFLLSRKNKHVDRFVVLRVLLFHFSISWFLVPTCSSMPTTISCVSWPRICNSIWTLCFFSIKDSALANFTITRKTYPKSPPPPPFFWTTDLWCWVVNLTSAQPCHSAAVPQEWQNTALAAASSDAAVIGSRDVGDSPTSNSKQDKHCLEDHLLNAILLCFPKSEREFWHSPENLFWRSHDKRWNKTPETPDSLGSFWQSQQTVACGLIEIITESEDPGMAKRCEQKAKNKKDYGQAVVDVVDTFKLEML